LDFSARDVAAQLTLLDWCYLSRVPPEELLKYVEWGGEEKEQEGGGESSGKEEKRGETRRKKERERGKEEKRGETRRKKRRNEKNQSEKERGEIFYQCFGVFFFFSRFQANRLLGRVSVNPACPLI
jgi:hypothetical protein